MGDTLLSVAQLAHGLSLSNDEERSSFTSPPYDRLNEPGESRRTPSDSVGGIVAGKNCVDDFELGGPVPVGVVDPFPSVQGNNGGSWLKQRPEPVLRCASARGTAPKRDGSMISPIVSRLVSSVTPCSCPACTGLSNDIARCNGSKRAGGFFSSSALTRRDKLPCRGMQRRFVRSNLSLRIDPDGVDVVICRFSSSLWLRARHDDP